MWTRGQPWGGVGLTCSWNSENLGGWNRVSEGERRKEWNYAGHRGVGGTGGDCGFYSRCEGSCQRVMSRNATPEGKWGTPSGDCSSCQGESWW